VSGRDETTYKSFFARVLQSLSGGSNRNLREERVREYIVYRQGHGARLKEVLQERYVLRNCSREEVDEIIRDPRLVHASRTSLEEAFKSGELDPATNSSARTSPTG
jgi:hypothetical protein